MKSKNAIIFSYDGFQDAELIYPYHRLLGDKFNVNIFANKNEIFGISGVKFSDCKLFFDITKLNVDDYSLVVVPSGVKALEKLRQENIVIDFIKDWDSKNKIIASICNGMQLLISAKIIKGKRVSAYYAMSIDVENAGAEFVDAPYVISDNIISCPHYKWMGLWMEEVIRFYNEKNKKN